MKHASTCTGCPKCRDEMRALLSMSPEQYCAWLTKQNEKLRSAAARGELRTGIHCQMTEDTMKEDYTPPDGYTPALRLRDASEQQTPEQALQAFEERLKNTRLRELATEHAALEVLSARLATPQPRLTAAELAEIPGPPDPYAEGIRALLAKEARGK